MKKVLFLAGVLIACSCEERNPSHRFSSVEIETVFQDSVSIRALEVMPGVVAFAGSGGVFGNVETATDRVRVSRQEYQGRFPEFRAVGHTNTDFFMLSAGDPALLFKTGEQGQMELVYTESGPGVFYDSMAFWDDTNGIAVGDALGGCLSLLLTRDGGRNWKKLPCEALPPALEREGAFAASDTNVALFGTHCWIGTTAGRIYHSPDLGSTWEVFQSPIMNSLQTQGIYSIDFHDEKLGFAIGGDYTKPETNKANKALSRDGGRQWELLADGADPGYKSCVQFIPGSGGMDLAAVGFTGVVYSGDRGSSWVQFSEESFYSIRFINDSVAYASGKGRIAKLTFR